MRPTRLLLSFLFFLSSSPILNSQQSTAAPPRDAQALAILQQSFLAMGGNVPSDSVAAGNVVIVAGSLTSTGAIRILTRGTNQTSIQFQTTNGAWSLIYSNGQANRVDAAGTTVLPLELAASSQSVYFPLSFLAGLLSNPDVSLQFLGQESVAASTANHIRAQNTFNSTPAYQFLSGFTTVDIWLDATTALPLKISFIRRDGGGSSPKIAISVAYSNYQTLSGVRYPFTIEEYVNGTLSATTTIQSVAFNTGLTNASFPIATEID